MYVCNKFIEHFNKKKEFQANKKGRIKISKFGQYSQGDYI